MEKNLLKLDQQICFPIYSLSRFITQQYQPLLAPLNLTYLQYLVMMVLWEEQQVTVKHLGERLFLDSGTLSPLLKKLEAKGFITRERRKQDERVVEIALTPVGQALKKKAQHVPEQLLCAFDANPDDLEAFKAQIDKMFHQLKPVS